MLSLSGCSKVTDDGIELIAENLRKLRSLDVSWCPRVTDAALEYIACDLNHLEELTLDRYLNRRFQAEGIGRPPRNFSRDTFYGIFAIKKPPLLVGACTSLTSASATSLPCLPSTLFTCGGARK